MSNGIGMSRKSQDIVQVLKYGYCVGCGACAAESGQFGMILNRDGAMVPDVHGEYEDLSAVSDVCPFSAEGSNESEIGRRLYGKSAHQHVALGYFLATYAGHVTESNFRQLGSSGGMGTWLLTEALRTDIVDTILHVRPVDPDTHNGRLFEYCTASTDDEIQRGGKSRYYPVTMDAILRYVIENPKRYAISGVPCFIKALRRLAARRHEINERIIFTVGLVCGHLKTTGFGECLAWQAGIEPSNIKSMDFRHKLNSGPASKYAFMARSKNGKHDIVIPMTKLLGRDWGMGFFKLNACEFCDDVTAETADVSIGDAWLPEYIDDCQGTNVVVVRCPMTKAMIEAAIEDGRLALSPVSPEQVVLSQKAGLRHRHEGLAYRLWVKDKKGEWRPEKRIKPSNKLPLSRKFILIMRQRLMKISINIFRLAKEKNNLRLFIRRMSLEISIYRISLIIFRMYSAIENALKIDKK
jgi:coenzyme F420 hydrogenase subunit beta